MCHKHIEVTFHENVNVILGRNGSKYEILDCVEVFNKSVVFLQQVVRVR